MENFASISVASESINLIQTQSKFLINLRDFNASEIIKWLILEAIYVQFVSHIGDLKRSMSIIL